MAKFCSNCAAPNPPTATRCSRCGMMLGKSPNSVNRVNGQLGKTDVGITNSKKSEKRTVFTIFAVLLAIISVVLIYNYLKKPDGKWFKENIPQKELLYKNQISGDGNIKTGSVEKAEIVEEYSEMGFHVFKCKIIEKCDEFSVERFYKFKCEKSGFNWIGIEVEEYKDDGGNRCEVDDNTYVELLKKKVPEAEKCENPIIEEKEGKKIVYFDIIESNHKFASITGKLGVYAQYNCHLAETKDYYMQVEDRYMSIDWNTKVEYDKSKIKWNYKKIAKGWLYEEEYLISFSDVDHSGINFLYLEKEGSGLNYEYQFYSVSSDSNIRKQKGTINLPSNYEEYLEKGVSASYYDENDEEYNGITIFRLTLDEIELQLRNGNYYSYEEGE